MPEAAARCGAAAGSGIPDAGLLEEKLGYRFRDPALLVRALTHTSYSNEQPGCASYERLEFLGDAVLEAVSSAYLYAHYPERREGELTKMRASLVCEPALAHCARILGLDRFILLGRGEEEGGGRGKDSIVSDVMEAVIGAVFLDSGEEIGPARGLILRTVLSDPEHTHLFYDAKSILQERAQKSGQELRYELVSEDGPAHDRRYTSRVLLDGVPAGIGTGRSKKLSEQHAAFAVLSAKEPEKTDVPEEH